MSQDPGQREPIVTVADDAMSASVTLPLDCDEGAIENEALAEIARSVGVLVDASVQERIAAVVDDYRANPRALSAVIALGKAAVAGEHERIEWAEGMNPEATTPDHEKASHYKQSAFPRAEEAAILAQVVGPTPGVAGVTVTGKAIETKAGRKSAWCFEESSVSNEGGVLRAKKSGVVMPCGKTIRVIDLLEVQDVDFSTGNINVEGSVHVRQAVRDRFVVSALEHVVIDGLVESAQISCGGDLLLRRGMAARERGKIRVGGSADVGFLNTVQGHIEGALTCRRELINCTLTIGGDLLGERAAIIGGRVTVGGSVRVSAIGSRSETGTAVLMGMPPEVSDRVRDVRGQRFEHEKTVQGVLADIALIEKTRPTAKQKERMTELNYRVAEIRGKITECDILLDMLEAEQAKHPAAELLVLKTIYAKAMLRVGEFEMLFERSLTGPVCIAINEDGKLSLKRGRTAGEPIGSYATVRKAA